MVHFGFAYNNPLFADRVLHLVVVAPVDATGPQVSGLGSPIQTEKLHVSSLILAAHSDYFMRLYSNGMCESSSEVATVQVTEEEREGLIHLIQYMYTGNLVESSDVQSTITLLTLADRFAISSCMEPLANALKKFPSCLNDYMLVLGLPESLKADKAVQPVLDQCKLLLAQQFQSIPAKKLEFFTLNMDGVKVVLDSDSLLVSYEEEVFSLMLEWLDANFLTPEEKLRAAEEVCSVIRFPWMTGDYLVDFVSSCPVMQTDACQELIMEALKFKSFTHSRQQQMIWKKMEHKRFRPRNNAIFENFWGSSKTFITDQTETSCTVYFEFPLELVICSGAIFMSRPFSLGGKYNFVLEARHGQIKSSYNQQLTCCISLVSSSKAGTCSASAPASPASTSTATAAAATAATAADGSSFSNSYDYLEYAMAMKRDYSQNYDTKATGTLDLQAGVCLTFNDFFSGWFIERGFSYPRWNITINGPVFLRLELKLKVLDKKRNPEPTAVVDSFSSME